MIITQLVPLPILILQILGIHLVGARLPGKKRFVEAPKVAASVHPLQAAPANLEMNPA